MENVSLGQLTGGSWPPGTMLMMAPKAFGALLWHRVRGMRPTSMTNTY